MNNTIACVMCGFVTLLLIGGAGAAEYKVSSADEIHQIKARLKPGDIIVMAAGEWNDQNIWLHANGSADKPITLRAQTPGKVIFAGNSSIALEGSHLVLSGVFL